MASTCNPHNYRGYEDFPPSTSASSGFTKPGKNFCYDIFINHFKHPLGEAIYKELDAFGLKVFLNSEELELGEEEVEAAFKSSWLYIPIFSEGYAQSKRCLEELSSIHNRGKGTKIVPIFCRVNPDDVRDEDMLPKTITEWVAKEGKKCQEFVVSANTSSSIQRQQQGEEFAAATSTSGGSIMLVRKVKYDVFINHRGPDVKRTLATSIHKMLTEMGLKVFLDSEELTWGGHFPSVLEEVIKSTWLNIVIFSEGYATSKWCLRELSLISRREGSMIVPIFYHVEPVHARYAKGSYGVAFCRHQDKRRHNPEKLEEWKEAIRIASYYVGHIVYSKEDEDKLLKKLADLVAKEGKGVQEFALDNTRSSIHPRAKLAFLSSGYARLTRDVRYDVHINHRGPDTKYTVAKSIYNRLKGIGLKVFLDIEELRLGDHLFSVIEEAISSAKIHIAIFSTNYAQSPWCLSELSLMLQTGAGIVPIFYYVDPADVRYAKGVYADAFDWHVNKRIYASEKIREWKEALHSASYYFGHIVKSKEDGDMLPYNIVYCVGKELGKIPLLVAEHPVSVAEAV